LQRNFGAFCAEKVRTKTFSGDVEGLA